MKTTTSKMNKTPRIKITSKWRRPEKLSWFPNGRWPRKEDVILKIVPGHAGIRAVCAVYWPVQHIYQILKYIFEYICEKFHEYGIYS